MALIAPIETSLGVTATFWVVGKVDIDNFGRQALITVYGYQDAKHANRESGTFLERIIINIYPYEFDYYFGPERLDKDNISPIKAAYEYLKTRIREFSEATDYYEPEPEKWDPPTMYREGKELLYNDLLYRVKKDHQSDEKFKPDITISWYEVMQ